MGGIWLGWWCWWRGGGATALHTVFYNHLPACGPLLYEANEKIPGYLYSSRA